MEILSESLKDTEETAKSFLEKLSPTGNQATVVVLSGNLGSGKTTFVQSVGKLLGISTTMTSPTFVLIKTHNLQHPNFNSLTHIDAYRLKSAEELKKLGWAEISADPKNLIFIEWPENVAGVIPEKATKISFEFIDEKTRKISF